MTSVTVDVDIKEVMDNLSIKELQAELKRRKVPLPKDLPKVIKKCVESYESGAISMADAREIELAIERILGL